MHRYVRARSRKGEQTRSGGAERGESVSEQDKNSIDMDSAYQEYAKLVYRFLYTHTHDAHWSEELMQETFLRAVTSIHRYDGSCKLSVWLCQIARHILYQELRKKKRMETVELADQLSDREAQDGETDVLRQESRKELYQAIHHLSEPEREVVLYRMTGELSFREIGEIMGRSENWCRTIFYRAKQKLKAYLSDRI